MNRPGSDLGEIVRIAHFRSLRYIQYKSNQIKMKAVCILALLCLGKAMEVVVDASQEPYAELKGVLGKAAIENSDNCDDRVNHITTEFDPILKRNVFLYTLHVSKDYQDGDRCNGDYSRQRCETSVQTSSPGWMQGDKGMTFTYAWKLFLDKDFTANYQFCHLHQIKLDGTNVGNPNLTLTARAFMQLQNEGNILAKAPLMSFKGEWLQIREKITYGANGCVDFTINRIRDSYELLSYHGCNVRLENNGIMIRPKFGFYRSLQDISKLKNEAIRIVDLCIGQDDSCHYDAAGNKDNSSSSLLKSE